jgi:D-cysteine desulfhydrase
MEIEKLDLGIFSIDDQLLVARDDLFPHYLGGNKARKMLNLIPEIERNNWNAIVTTGGIQSNHCRVVALACAARGWKCKLVLHGSHKRFLAEKGNALIMRLADAQLEFVSPAQVGPAMETSMNEFRNEGLNPYYLNGGGHNLAGVQAYVDAVYELKKSLPPEIQVNNIFLASGTGSTQAGIIAGCKEIGWSDAKVHGISIGRRKDSGINSVHEALNFIYPDQDKHLNEILFHDDFLFGGYGVSDSKLHNFLIFLANKTGLILDETYTGKAFWGMINLIKRNNLKGTNLFWHTGGLLNLMA